MHLSSRALGFIFVLLAGIGFGFLGIFAKWGYSQDLSVGEILTWRFLTASFLLGSYLIVFRRELFKIPKSEILISLSLGVLGYAVFSTLYFKSIQGISVALAAMILFTFPVFVTLGAYFFLKDKIGRLQWISLFLSMLGLIVLLWGPVVVQSFEHLAYAFLASLTYAAYVLFSSRFQKTIHPLVSSFFVMLAASVTLFLFHQPNPVKLLTFNLSQYAVFVGLATVSSIMPLSFFLAGLQKLKSSEASIAITIEPVVASVAAFMILNEIMTPQQLLGALIVLAGLILNAISK